MQVVKNSDILFVAVKPQYVKLVLKEAKQHLTDKHLIVSIAAGIPLEALQVLKPPVCACNATLCHDPS